MLPPGARHERHRHPNCDEFLVVLARPGRDLHRRRARAGAARATSIFTPAGHWHGFDNTSDDDVLLLWGWRGAGSLDAAGYELPADG